MLEAKISYDDFEVQKYLCDFVPSCSRRQISLDELSVEQRELAGKMRAKPCTKQPIMTSDFKPQQTILSLDYAALLVRLGVNLNGIVAALTGFKLPFFRPTMTQMLSLKSNARNEYFRKLAKLSYSPLSKHKRIYIAFKF